MMDADIEYRVNDILDNLEDLGYTDYAKRLDTHSMFELLETGFSSPDLRSLLSSIANNISQLDGAGSSLFINKDDESEFNKSIQSFLNHYHYPYGGDPRVDKLRLLEYLVTELQTTRLLVPTDAMEVDTIELPENIAPIYLHLKQACETLKVPFDKLSPTQAAENCIKKINELLEKLPKDYISLPILASTPLSPQDMEKLKEIQAALDEEYKQRFIVLRKRLEVTLQSFLWSDKGKEKEAEIKKVITTRLRDFPTAPTVTLHEMLSAQPDIARITKTSSVSTKTPSDLKSLLMAGDVPDRGGRPQDRQDPQMPSFRAREDQPQEQRSSRRGRVHGAWGGDKKGHNNNNNNNNNNEQQETEQHNQASGRGGHGGGHRGGHGGHGGQGGGRGGGGWGGKRGGGRK